MKIFSNHLRDERDESGKVSFILILQNIGFYQINQKMRYMTIYDLLLQEIYVDINSYPKLLFFKKCLNFILFSAWRIWEFREIWQNIEIIIRLEYTVQWGLFCLKFLDFGQIVGIISYSTIVIHGIFFNFQNSFRIFFRRPKIFEQFQQLLKLYLRYV